MWKKRPTSGPTLNFAGMQLNWFLNQNCNLELDWTNYKLMTNVNSDTFLPPFPFKWNGVFCPKRRHFIHCSLKKKTQNGVVLNDTIRLLLPLDVQKIGEGNFCSPAFSTAFPFKKTPTKNFILLSWPVASRVLEKRRRRASSGDHGAATQWPPQPCLSPVFL